MAASIDILDPNRPKRAVIVASNPAVSGQTGWPIGFWWSELAHPYWELTGHGYGLVVASPDGGALQADSWSDPRDESGYSAEDLISLGFINSPAHARLVEDSKPLAEIGVEDYDAALFVGGQGPMYTFWSDERDGNLITGQQQYSGAAAARLMIEALGT
jgi:putative intracellular protease/amidase